MPLMSLFRTDVLALMLFVTAAMLTHSGVWALLQAKDFMPIYHYKCDSCNRDFEITQSIKDDSLSECILCGQNNIGRILYCPIIIDRTPKTVGSLSELNTDKMGVYGRDQKREELNKDKKAVKRPEYRPDRDTPDMAINTFTPTQLERYINDGVRPIGK